MKEILCTLGPASMDVRVIERLAELGVTLFRINLSHTAVEDLEAAIDHVQRASGVPVCLDTEGAQVRTGRIVGGAVEVRENAVIRAHDRPVPGDTGNITLYPGYIVSRLEVGDFISIDFNAVLTQVVALEDGAAVMRVINGGKIGSNKAVTVERAIDMPPLTEKDEASMAVGKRMGIRHVALSFAQRPEDVDTLRRHANDDAFVISKIECRPGVANLDAIAQRSDALLIDRGDLSREFPIERIPAAQKAIIGRAKAAGRKVYVATNLLESMVSDPAPTRAEVNDIYNTLADGADGLVLAAETAIGNYPIRCAGMIVKMMREFETSETASISGMSEPGLEPDNPMSLLVPPHGGALVHREDPSADLVGLPTLALSETDLMDVEQFAIGTYSPLSGFMARDTLNGVLDSHRLPDGSVWTLPIILQVPESDVAKASPGSRVALVDGDGTAVAALDVSETYQVDLDDLCRRWFLTDSDDHPGVQRVKRAGPHVVAGDVTLVHRRPSPTRHYELTPAQTRFIFTHKGWSRVVGFHTRNAVHRVHEYIQIQALERTGADGLYISPVIGPKKANDFLPDPIMKSYQTMLEFGLYPPGRVVLGSFPTYSRYAGPREAVFTALCRKNMGCSHFIIGRDHTGVGDFYAPDANAKLFDALDDLGIEPVFFDAHGYDPESRGYAPLTQNGTKHISGTEVRETLRSGERLPNWFMRDLVQDVLQAEIAAGRPVFVD